MIISRRKFVTGLIAAPAIVAASRLMPVKQMLWTPTRELLTADRTIYVSNMEAAIYEDGSIEYPFYTIQKAMDLVADDLDLNGHNLTINLYGVFQDLNIDLKGKAAFEVDLGRICQLERCVLTGFAPERTAFEVRTGAMLIGGDMSFTGRFTSEQLFKQKPVEIKTQKEVPHYYRFKDKWDRPK